MIKLIASDIDGTLLEEGTDRLNPELFTVIRELKEKGIIFAAASGRQYSSMRYVFEPVADDIIFIAENGTNVMCRGKTMSCSYIDPDLAREMVTYMRELEGVEIVLSTPERLYLEKGATQVLALLEAGYHNEVEIVDDLIPCCDRTNKITAYSARNIEAVCEKLKERFEGRLNIVIAGAIWVDMMNDTADKGTALAEIQEIMNIGVDETMAFGDNCNDIGMLGRAQRSYAVANAHPQLKEAARYIAPPQEEGGVIKTIREQILNQ